MHQIVYIDVDEEITSILDRIRQEVAVDIFLVVPKGAMLLNSIINLKLLKKETEKMGKTVSIVAPNDNRAKVMIERAGIKAEDYNQAMNEQQLQEASINIIKTAHINKAIEDSVGETSQQITQEEFNVGSRSFFGNNKQTQINPSFNSGQVHEENQSENYLSNQQRIANSSPLQFSRSNHYQNNAHQKEQAVLNNGQYQEIKNQQISQSTGGHINGHSQKDNRFNYFNKQGSTQVQGTHSGKKSLFRSKILLLAISCIGIILLGGVGWYITNYPKLKLTIKPLSKEIDKEIKIIAKDSITKVNVEDKIIPGEYTEISLEKTMEFNTTGEKVVDKKGAKAKGMVTIENSFSDKPQRLVRTTRIISKDGKLFRLSKDVLVPGMKDNIPGKVNVPVEADKPGKEFNIDKGAFVIAAWKGTPKGDKFKVSSSESMKGGVTSADSKTQKVVSKNDLDRARKETIKALDASLEEEIKKRLNLGQKVVLSSVEKEILSSKASHLVDTIADKFTYTTVYKIKMIVFEEADIKKVVSVVIQKEIGEEYQLEPNFKIDINRGVADLNKKTVTIYVDVEGTSHFKINTIKLKEEIVGKNAESVKKSLNRDAGIQSAEIKLSPAWSSKAPSKTDKITIEIVN